MNILEVRELAPTDRRRNVLLLGADLSLFMMALGLLAPVTLIPLFVSKLTDNPLAIGALTAAFQLGWLPQLVAAGYQERSHRKRWWLLFFGGLERVPALGLTLCALALPLLGVPLTLGLVYLFRFAQTLAGGPASTAWMDYVAGSVPAEQRGKFMSLFSTSGHVLGAALAALSAPLLERLPFPQGFAACFGLAFLVLLLGYLPLFWVVDPPGPPPRPRVPFRDQLAELPAVLADDAPFRRFMFGMCLGSLGTMSAAFLVVYGVGQLGASDELAARYTVALLGGQVVANLAFGWLADRHGFLAVGRVSAAAIAVLTGIALVARDPLWLLASFALLGANQAGWMLARMVGPVEFAPPERRPTYLALATALTSLMAAIAPLLGGQIVALFGFQWLFILSAACALAGVAAFGLARTTDDGPRTTKGV